MDKIKKKFRTNPDLKSPTEIKGSLKRKSRGNSTNSSLVFAEDSLPEKNDSYLEELITGHDSSINKSISQYESTDGSCTNQMLYRNLSKRKLPVDSANSITPQALVNHNDASLPVLSTPCLKTPNLTGSYENEDFEMGSVSGSKVIPSQSKCTEDPTDDFQNQDPLQGKMKSCDNKSCYWNSFFGRIS